MTIREERLLTLALIYEDGDVARNPTLTLALTREEWLHPRDEAKKEALKSQEP